MGCGCNKKAKARKYTTEEVAAKKRLFSKMWEKSKVMQKPLVIKEINKP